MFAKLVIPILSCQLALSKHVQSLDLLDLDIPVAKQIIGYLDSKDLRNVGRSCKNLHQLSKQIIGDKIVSEIVNGKKLHYELPELASPNLMICIKRDGSISRTLIDKNNYCDRQIKIFTEHTDLLVLTMPRNRLSEKRFKKLINGLRFNDSIAVIDFENMGIKGRNQKSIGCKTRKNTNLSALYLGKNLLKNDGCGWVARTLLFSSIVILDLSYNLIEDTGLTTLSQSIAYHQTLKKLILKGNNIADDGVRHLKKALSTNRSLIHLDLSYNKLKPVATYYLSKLLIQQTIRLKVLDLSGNNFGAIVLMFFDDALRINNILEELYLNHNNINNSNYAIDDISNILLTNQTLEIFDLRGNSFSQDDIIIINNAAKNCNLKIKTCLDA